MTVLQDDSVKVKKTMLKNACVWKKVFILLNLMMMMIPLWYFSYLIVVQMI